MITTFRVFNVLVVACAIAGCVMSHGPEGVSYSTPSPSGSVGVTSSDAGGSLSGGAATPDGDKEKRGNTPVGMDRDGHGPAAGAIVDPTGAATRGTPH